MIQSKILGKSYNTKQALKSQITKRQKDLKETINLFKDLKKMGQTHYTETLYNYPMRYKIDEVIARFEKEYLELEKEKKINL